MEDELIKREPNNRKKGLYATRKPGVSGIPVTKVTATNKTRILREK
ncbi:hypothetical protein ABC653_11185 [Lacticaseibacillus paracasei]